MASSVARGALLELLGQYRGEDPVDAMQAARIVQFVEREPACALRTTVEGHLTGSAWIVNGAGTHVLLLHHRKLNRWLQPGGHADGELDLAAVALREAREESGLQRLSPWASSVFDVDIHEIPVRGAEPAHLHFDLRFVLVADDAELLIGNQESSDLRWVALGEVEQLTLEASILRMRDKWLRLRDANLRRVVRPLLSTLSQKCP